MDNRKNRAGLIANCNTILRQTNYYIYCQIIDNNEYVINISWLDKNYFIEIKDDKLFSSFHDRIFLNNPTIQNYNIGIIIKDICENYNYLWQWVTYYDENFEIIENPFEKNIENDEILDTIVHECMNQGLQKCHIELSKEIGKFEEMKDFFSNVLNTRIV